MGNSLGRKKTAKVMKIDGQTMKFKTPVYANEVLKNYPSMVLLESEEVKHFGVRAKPIEPQQELKPKRLYFLVELPKFPEEKINKTPRRVRSGIQMSAKDRLETLMLARRSASDLTIMKPASVMSEECSSYHNNNNNSFASGPLNGVEPQAQPMRLKLRLPKSEMEKLMMQSKDGSDVGEKIMKLCMNNNNGDVGVDLFQSKNEPLIEEDQSQWKKNNGGILIKKGIRSREKRVGFLPITEGEIQLAMTAS